MAANVPPAGWRTTFRRAAANADDRFDALRRRFQRRFSAGDPFAICAYMGYGAPGTPVHLRGRVLSGRPLPPPTDADTVWTNLLATYRRLESDEVPGARVLLSLGGAAVEAVTDAEGYYSATLPPPESNSGPWHTGSVRLLDPPAQPVVEATTAALIPASADFAVVSDIDDTILVSDATHWLRAARQLFLNNARSRLAFPGVAAFYRALQRGLGPASFNPIFYVSSSPWNLYDLLTDFMAFQQIPAGPLFLRDYGLDAPGPTVAVDHRGHKLTQITQLLADFPMLPFVLIGDSGQMDPETYAELAQRYRDRIRAIYIRDVTVAARDAAVDQLRSSVGALGIPMLRVADSAAAHAHAATLGLCAPPAA